MVYADTIRGASGLVDPFSNTKLKSVWDFNTMSDILGPVDDGNGDKAYNTYRIYRKRPRTLVRPAPPHRTATRSSRRRTRQTMR